MTHSLPHNNLFTIRMCLQKRCFCFLFGPHQWCCTYYVDTTLPLYMFKYPQPSSSKTTAYLYNNDLEQCTHHNPSQANPIRPIQSTQINPAQTKLPNSPNPTHPIPNNPKQPNSIHLIHSTQINPYQPNTNQLSSQNWNPNQSKPTQLTQFKPDHST